MQDLNLYQLFTDKLDAKKIPYAVTGSVASIIYGEPRMTHDIDIVIEMSVNQVEDFIKAFPVEEFYCPPVEILKIEILRTSRGHCNIIHYETGFKADIYFSGENQFQKWAITNARYFDYNESKIAIAPPEYVIVKKLEFYKEGQSQKHINDIKAIIFNSKELINFPLLEEYISGFGLKKEWQLCK
jgi:hypothetical protein